MFSTSAATAQALANEDNTLAHPHQLLPKILRSRRKEFVEPKTIKIRVGTWNVASGAAPTVQEDIKDWITQGEVDAKNQSQGGPYSNINPAEVDIYAIGLQEVIDINAAGTYVRYVDPAVAGGWKTQIEEALPKGYECIVQEQMLGLLLLIFVSPDIKPDISSIAPSQVGTGLMGYMSNKGAVSARLVVGETTRIVFLNCHLAALATATDRRNWDANEIARRTIFPAVDKSVIGIDDEEPSTRDEGLDDADVIIWFGDMNYRIDVPNDEIRRLLASYLPSDFPPLLPPSSPVTADSAGHFSNNAQPMSPTSPTLSRSSTMNSVTGSSQTSYDLLPGAPKTLESALSFLMERDQLYVQQKFGRVFDGYKECPIKFLPTYRYEIGTIGHWDNSEKMRAPSWCDRILFKVKTRKRTRATRAMSEPKTKFMPGSFNIEEVVFENEDSVELNPKDKDDDSDEEDLVVSTGDMALSPTSPKTPTTPGIPPTPGVVHLEQHFYTSHQSITSSDHKPVSALFSLTYPTVIPTLRHAIHAQITKDLDKVENERRPIVTMIFEQAEGHPKNGQEGMVSFGDVHLSEEKRRLITVANTGMVRADLKFIARPSENYPGLEEVCKRWMKIHFIKTDGREFEAAPGQIVSIEPGDTVTLRLSVRVANSVLLDELNSGKGTLEDLLVLRIEGGRDVFLMISANWLRTCFGRKIEELVSIPENSGGARAYFAEEKKDGDGKMKTLWSAPREIYRMTDYILEKVRLITDPVNSPDKDPHYLSHPGWPFESTAWTTSELSQTLLCSFQDSLDTDTPFEPPAGNSDESLVEHMSHMLIRFFRLLPDGVIPRDFYERVIRANGNKKLSEQLLETLPSTHANIFIYLTGFLSELIALLSTPRLPPRPSETDDSGVVNSARPVPDKNLVVEKLMTVFGEVLVQRPKQASGSRRAEEKIKGFIGGFVHV